MRRVTLTVVGLVVLVSLATGILVGRMAGGGSNADRDHGSLIATVRTSATGTSEPSTSPVPARATPTAEDVRRSETPHAPWI